MHGAIFGVTILIALGFYCLPTIIVEIRGIERGAGIFWVNLIFGWTVFGWIAALIWALAKKDSPKGKQERFGSEQADTWDFQARREDSAIYQDDHWVLGIEDVVESPRNGRSSAGIRAKVGSQAAIPDNLPHFWPK